MSPINVPDARSTGNTVRTRHRWIVTREVITSPTYTTPLATSWRCVKCGLRRERIPGERVRYMPGSFSYTPPCAPPGTAVPG